MGGLVEPSPAQSGMTEPESEFGVQTMEETQVSPQWKVILLDDDEHTYDYVVEMLMHACSLSKESAFRCAVEVDLSGETTVFYGTHEECKRRQGKIHGYGADPRLLRSRGSMQADIRGR
jgi:ATP-dependent Clp protease adaptor protein ClpS